MLKKKLLTFLIILVVLISIGTTAYAQRTTDAGGMVAIFDVSFGFQMAAMLSQDEDATGLPLSFGFQTNALSYDEAFLFMWFPLYEGDPTTGLGAIELYLTMDMSMGIPKNDAVFFYSGERKSFLAPILIFFADAFGEGNHLRIFANPKTYTDPDVPGLAFGGYATLTTDFTIGDDMYLMVDFFARYDNGISEDSEGLYPEPLDMPPGFGRMKTEFAPTVAFGGIEIAEDVFLQVDATFNVKIPAYQTVDEMIEADWYDPPIVMPDDEKIGYYSRYGISASAFLTAEVDDLGIVQVANFFDYKFNTKYLTNQSIALLNANDMLDGFTFEFFGRFIFLSRAEQTISGETIDVDGDPVNTFEIEAMPFKVQEFLFSIYVDYNISEVVALGFDMKPYLKLKTDLAGLINATEDYSMPYIPWIAELGVKFGLGPDGLLKMPVYVRLMNVSLQNYRLYEYQVIDRYNGYADEYVRLVIGIAFEAEFGTPIF